MRLSLLPHSGEPPAMRPFQGSSAAHPLFSSWAAAHPGGVWAGTRHLGPPADHCRGRQALSRGFVCILGGLVPAGAQGMKRGFQGASLVAPAMPEGV